MSDFIKTATSAATTFAAKGGALAPYYRLTSLMRLPSKNGAGVYNEATLYHAGDTLRIGWTSPTVDSRLRRGDIVTVRAGRGRARHPEVLPVLRIARVDQPVAAVNPFDLLPSSWLHDRTLAQRAKDLWEQMDRPLQHLLNAVLWDGARFYRYVTGPRSAADYPAPPGGNFRRSVALAEEALLLAEGLPNVARGVLVSAALLHEAGKADDFHLSPDGRGLTLSERGRWIGCEYTLLEWLAVARTKAIVPDALYLLLVHVLVAMRRPPESPQAIETAILSVARGFVDSPECLRQADRLMPCAPLKETDCFHDSKNFHSTLPDRMAATQPEVPPRNEGAPRHVQGRFPGRMGGVFCPAALCVVAGRPELATWVKRRTPMKPHRIPLTRTSVRLKPGRLLRLPPRFLKYAGWRPGDVLLVQLEDAHLVWTRLPDERTWRIDRLRRRTGSMADADAVCRRIRTFRDYLALRRERTGKTSFFDRLRDCFKEKP